MVSFVDTIYEKLRVENLNEFLFNLIFAVVLLVLGIFIGKIVEYILKKGIEKANLQKTIKYSFIHLFLTVIKWSIYILFLNLALGQLNIPQLTNWLTSVLVVIPALVGALLIIAVGFAIAVYLRDLIEESNIVKWQILSLTIFYFILYVFIVFAIKTALISLDSSIVNIIIIIFTAVVSLAIAYNQSRKK